LVRFGRADRAHLVEVDVAAERDGLQCGFRASKTSADDSDLLHPSSIGDCGSWREEVLVGLLETWDEVYTLCVLYPPSPLGGGI